MRESIVIRNVGSGEGTLGSPEPDQRVVKFTVSPNSKLRLTVLRENKKYQYRYDMCNHKEQYDYLNEYMKRVYLPNLDVSSRIEWCYELNESNNMHIHGMIIDKTIQDDYDLQAFRKNIMSHPMTVNNMVKKARRLTDWMNNICYIDTIEGYYEYKNYMNKQMAIKKRYPNEGMNIIIKEYPKIITNI